MSPSPTHVDLTQLPVRIHPASRLVQLFGGLVLYGASMALMVRSGLGLAPWSVLDQGIARLLHCSFGTAAAVTGVVVLAMWIPLRQRPGIGTVANVAVIAVSVDLTLIVLPPTRNLLWQVVLLVGGILLNGLATATYVGARLGPGPRDGLMTGLHARTARSIRQVRTAIELSVLVVGWLLGGTVGAGTALYAAAIGPVTQRVLPVVAVRGRR